MKHRISQLDGQYDCEVNSSEPEKNPCPLCQNCAYCVNRSCPNCEYLSSKEGFSRHIMNDHEPKDVFQHFGEVWTNKNIGKHSENMDHYHYTKWKIILSSIRSENALLQKAQEQ